MPPVLPPRTASTPTPQSPVPQNPISPNRARAARWRRGLACLLLLAAGSALGGAAPLGVSVELPDPTVRQIYSANR